MTVQFTLHVIIVSLTALTVGGCSDRSSERQYAYLPAELSKPSTLTRAEEAALRFELNAGRTPLGLSIDVVDGLPSAYVESASVKLRDDHIDLHLKVNISQAGGRELWQSKASPELREKVYTHVVTKAVEDLSLRLKCSKDKIRVTWTNFNTRDKGTFIEGKLVGNYGNER